MVVEAGAATEPQDRADAPALFEVRAHALLIVPVRLALGLAGLAAARLRGVPAGASLGLVAFGAAVMVFAMLADRRRRLFWSRVQQAEPAPAGGPLDEWWRTMAGAAFPSTLMLTVVTAVALPLNAELAALLAGILVGIGIGSLMFGLEIAAWERRRGERLLAGHGDRAQFYTRSG